MEKQQHPESAMDCQSWLKKGFCSNRQTQLFCPLVTRLNIITLRLHGRHDEHAEVLRCEGLGASPGWICNKRASKTHFQQQDSAVKYRCNQIEGLCEEASRQLDVRWVDPPATPDKVLKAPGKA
jgi:hypothetical protein